MDLQTIASISAESWRDLRALAAAAASDSGSFLTLGGGTLVFGFGGPGLVFRDRFLGDFFAIRASESGLDVDLGARDEPLGVRPLEEIELDANEQLAAQRRPHLQPLDLDLLDRDGRRHQHDVAGL